MLYIILFQPPTNLVVYGTKKLNACDAEIHYNNITTFLHSLFLQINLSDLAKITAALHALM